jgi:c-di-GMP-binding flagellar brake protein YcgR
MQEKRKFVRINKTMVVSYTISRNFLKSGTRSKNVSLGGMAMPTIQSFEPGTILDVEIRLDEDKKVIPLMAEVVWSQRKDDSRYPFEIGVKFFEVNDCDRDNIRLIAAQIKPGVFD